MMANYMIDNEENFIDSLRIAYSAEDARFNDVEFSLAGGAKACANKYLLASQSQYFEAMFYGNGSVKDESRVNLEWCSRTSMKKILDFLSTGKANIGDLEILELLELLEASRQMGLENLSKKLECYVRTFTSSRRRMQMSSVNVLKGLDYALQNKFENISSWFLQYIDENFQDFLTLKPEEAGNLSSTAMIKLLGFEGEAKRIDLLTFFVTWKKAGNRNDEEANIDISQHVRLSELNAEELKTARSFGMFPVDDIMDNLERIVAENEVNFQVALNKKDLLIAKGGMLCSAFGLVIFLVLCTMLIHYYIYIKL